MLDSLSDPKLLAAIVAVFALLVITSRVPLVKTVLSLAIWAALSVLLVTIVAERSRFDPALQKLTARLNLDDQGVVGKELRVPLSRDGHFWVRADIDGVERRMLVDSGATVTAVATSTATEAGLKNGLSPVLLRTANGAVAARSAKIRELRIGNIVARDLGAVVSPSFGETNVLGMNFLTRLKGWRVEDGTLILVPHHPQAVS